eukprot:GFYU01018513.1.p1 GENE.GFYU01018513.1~~GFYU01018513.1.p1  ORF type:complete len:414 (-),score=69.89 GFYU01018513.1:110-1351(-)
MASGKSKKKSKEKTKKSKKDKYKRPKHSKRHHTSSSSSDDDDPRDIVEEIRALYDTAFMELYQVMTAIDGGQYVDISNIASKDIRSALKRLFQSLKLARSKGNKYSYGKDPTTHKKSFVRTLLDTRRHANTQPAQQPEKTPSTTQPSAQDTSHAPNVASPPQSPVGPTPPEPEPEPQAPGQKHIGPAAPTEEDRRRAIAMMAAAVDQSSDDDDIGPRLPGQKPHETVMIDAESRQREEAAAWAQLRGDGDTASAMPAGREEWMLSVPQGKNRLAEVGSRTFSAKPYNPNVDSSSWTATPQERAQMEQQSAEEKLTNKSSTTHGHAQREHEKAANDDKKRLVDQYNSQHRPKSLTEQHAETLKKKAETSTTAPTYRPWDRERDLNTSRKGHMDSSKLIENAKQYSSRFGGSSFL